MATERRDALAMARGKRMKESLLVRCRSLLASLSSFPPHKLAPSPRSRLAKLLRSELRFLLRTDPDSHRVRLSRVLPNRPSTRMMDLTESGKIKEKNKIVFGTGDSWHASTLTANTAFVRAVRQTGMAFAIIEHRPRALVGDKCTC